MFRNDTLLGCTLEPMFPKTDKHAVHDRDEVPPGRHDVSKSSTFRDGLVVVDALVHP